MSDINTLRRQLVQRLESLQRAGVTHISRGPVVVLPVSSASSEPLGNETRTEDARPERPAAVVTPSATSLATSLAGVEPPRRTPPVQAAPGAVFTAESRERPVSPPAAARNTLPLAIPSQTLARGENLPLEARRKALESLCAEVRECRKCPVLVANRTQTVFGVGSLQPRLCFFGEAPGADEDEQGEPFVGKAGQLLNKMIDAMSLRRDDVYILNVLKCRPPGNRPPLPEEADQCRPFFERQLDVLRPEFICCLGASAAQALLKTKFSIGKLRGKFFDYGTAKVLATYHPAYLLRNPSAKKPVWEDLQQLMAVMGLQRKV